MNDEYLLVDGYNIIHSWSELKAIADDDLESARQKLVNILADYQGYNKINIIVIFDAYMVKGSKGKKYKYGNVDVVFTKEAETADHFIEKVTHKIGKIKNVKVATSDKLEQIIILGGGATRISAKELLEEINTSKKSQHKRYIDKRPPKENLLEDRLSPEMREWMEKVRRQ